VMDVDAPITGRPDRREKLIWGWVRLLIGFAQISLAGLTFGVLITAGVTRTTIFLALTATAIAAVSRLIYRGRKRSNVHQVD
jgi:hypothetical protein